MTLQVEECFLRRLVSKGTKNIKQNRKKNIFMNYGIGYFANYKFANQSNSASDKCKNL